MRVIAVFIGSLALSGCAQMEAIRQKGLEMQAGPPGPDDDAQCQSYGAVPGTPAYINCRVQLHTTDESSRRALVGAYLLRR